MYISKFVDTRNVFLCNLIHVYEIIIFFDETIVFRGITLKSFRGLRGRDRMVVGFTSTYANQCLSPLTLWVRTPFMARCTRYNIMW